MANTVRAVAIPMPSIDSIRQARKEFIQGEPRNLFYVVATELIDLASRQMTRVSVAEALAVLLQTWNISFYRFRGGFQEQDLADIKALIADHAQTIKKFRGRSITTFESSEEHGIEALFASFETVLGAVGAAKSLHLLASSFFPLWDRAIAKAYHVKVDRNGYLRFMRIAKEQCRKLDEEGAPWNDPLKAMDEYNYCTHTLKLPR